MKLYTKNNCVQCKMTKRFLQEHGISYEEVNVEENKKVRLYLKSNGFHSVPVLDTGNGFIIGFAIDKLRELIKK